MRRFFAFPGIVLAGSLVSSTLLARSLSAQLVSAGASAVALLTRESPAIGNRDLTEGYLSQPMLMGAAAFPRYGLDLGATMNFEGLTLRRGELNAGMYGEGYVDRRHPHTYLHELVGTWRQGLGSSASVSLTGGKGFAPFGSDDPMSRPLVKYPVNHHLAQILERAIVVGAANAGPLTLEVATFNGDEPTSPSDFPNSSRLFDSWSARATGRFWQGSEIQTSFARVLSPEVASGGGLTQKKWSASGRYETGALYALAELARTEEYESGRNAFSFNSLLAEVSVSGGMLKVAARMERTERPEEERLSNPFRSPLPASDLSLLGRTRWTVLSLNASHSFNTRHAGRIAPFFEVARSYATSLDGTAVFDPKIFYGSNVISSVSVGMRLGVGMVHNRMGRYGSAIQPDSMKMHGMEGMEMEQ